MGYHKKKKYQCPYCVKSFKKGRMLKSHVKDAHPDTSWGKFVHKGTVVGRFTSDKPNIQEVKRVSGGTKLKNNKYILSSMVDQDGVFGQEDMAPINE